ncbi:MULTISPECIES: NUDIX hydrolase [unclassified Corallococcus]|uniref:NUDIX hydrolase n=1 Tax=unclassified Corallococcus TaxID=2685029 RepID=UPI001A90487D|nr:MULTISPECIES: NUDIX hydrolase [unclassified Corallococcus]MBN9685525.1 NUDIX hydrolase [Corallococcus sp. NCSPR001]WAS83027.1 NUDIX hydrolase [Corallococcus sp. NCRR]
MTDGRSWQGNWKVRLYERVHERGHASLTEFANSRPTVPLLELAQELGRDDVAAIQVFQGLLSEAEQRRQVTRLLRDVFAREVAGDFPEGWPVITDEATRFQVIKLLARLGAFTPETHEASVSRAGDSLLASPPPAGWRPLGPDDALLLTLLPDNEA